MFEIIGIAAVIVSVALLVLATIVFVIRTIWSWDTAETARETAGSSMSWNMRNDADIISIKERLADIESELDNLKRDGNIDFKGITQTLSELSEKVDIIETIVNAIEVVDEVVIEDKCKGDCKCQSKK